MVCGVVGWEGMGKTLMRRRAFPGMLALREGTVPRAIGHSVVLVGYCEALGQMR